MTLRQVCGSAVDLLRYTVRTGRWWFPFAVLVLAVGAALAATAHVTVPTVVYALF